MIRHTPRGFAGEVYSAVRWYGRQHLALRVSHVLRFAFCALRFVVAFCALQDGRRGSNIRTVTVSHNSSEISQRSLKCLGHEAIERAQTSLVAECRDILIGGSSAGMSGLRVGNRFLKRVIEFCR